jgi:putative copper resistance protein D
MAMELVQPGMRFVQYAMLLGLFGGFGFHAMTAHGFARSNGLRGWVIFAAIAAPVVVAFSLLTDIAAMMGQSPFDPDWAAIASLLSATDFGQARIVRVLAVVLAWVPALLFRPSRAGSSVAASLYGAALASMAWSGHAAAGEGFAGWLHRLNDAVHLLAAGLWLGAIGWFALLVLRTYARSDPERSMGLAAALKGFAPVGATLVLLLVVTGVVNSQMIFGLGQLLPVLATGYGLLLVLKLGLVALMLLCARFNRSTSRSIPEAGSAGPVPDHQALQSMRRPLLLELLLAVAVIAVVAWLGLASPMPGDS